MMEEDHLEDTVVEERHETCSAVSKMVKIKILRRKVNATPRHGGEIVGFECASSSSSCESKCSYKLLMDDY